MGVICPHGNKCQRMPQHEQCAVSSDAAKRLSLQSQKPAQHLQLSAAEVVLFGFSNSTRECFGFCVDFLFIFRKSNATGCGGFIDTALRDDVKKVNFRQSTRGALALKQLCLRKYAC